MEGYDIIEEGNGSFIFVTDNNVEYQLIMKDSDIIYEDFNGLNLKVIELVLNCDINVASKDYKTAQTLMKFCKEVSSKYDAIYMQIHNQQEQINNNKTKRRGLSRIKLWNRLVSRYFSSHILLTNLVLCPNKNSDILSIIIKRDSIYLKQFVTNFYRFCYAKMYKKLLN